MLSKQIADMSFRGMVKIWIKRGPEKFEPTGRGVATL
jgi:hypothetical protein